MPRFRIESIEDSRLDPYRQLKRTNLTRWSGLFIAEGKNVVRRLVGSDLETQSVLVTEEEANEAFRWLPESIDSFVIPRSMSQDLVGYNFHSGYLACGVRPEPLAIERFLAIANRLRSDERQTVVVCPNVTDPDNIGAIIRIAACFGIDLLMLGRGCSDPFSRRVLRVSMGTAFRIPILESANLADDLKSLQVDAGYQLTATALAADAIPLTRAPRPPRLAILLGNEAHGLEPEWIACCDQTVTIPMAPGVDSLNVAVAAGIFLHHFTRVAQPLGENRGSSERA